MIIRNALVYSPEYNFRKMDVRTEGERLAAVMPAGSFDEHISSDDTDAGGMYLIPGLTDIHFHGCVGYDFSDGTEEAIAAIARYEAENGITTICPATMTYSEEILTCVMRAAGKYHGCGGAELVGINMEGPFISMEKRGAQNPEYIMDPDTEMYRRLQQESGGLIKLVDLAPEKQGAMEFIQELKGEVTVSIAHTTADYDTAMQAFKQGASHVTHLYNAMPPFEHRSPGVVGAALDTPGCEVELICDGVHVHPSVIRATIKMFGADRVIMISDTMRAAGMPDGSYLLGGQKVQVSGSHATLEDGTLAGSVTNLMQSLVLAVKEMGIPLETAVRCAAVNPARSIGIYDRYGSIEPGKIANLVLLSQDLDIVKVILNGTQLI